MRVIRVILSTSYTGLSLFLHDNHGEKQMANVYCINNDGTTERMQRISCQNEDKYLTKTSKTMNPYKSYG
jgi:hypothetical protein